MNPLVIADYQNALLYVSRSSHSSRPAAVKQQPRPSEAQDITRHCQLCKQTVSVDCPQLGER